MRKTIFFILAFIAKNCPSYHYLGLHDNVYFPLQSCGDHVTAAKLSLNLEKSFIDLTLICSYYSYYHLYKHVLTSGLSFSKRWHPTVN